MKTIGTIFLLLGMATAAMALPPPPVAPEIDPGSTASAVTLMIGALLLIRGRRRT
jgi:hypothetical protein